MVFEGGKGMKVEAKVMASSPDCATQPLVFGRFAARRRTIIRQAMMKMSASFLVTSFLPLFLRRGEAVPRWS